ncbi:MAG: dihydrofolate reductase family protein [Mariprofundaceae bacterium]
MSVLCMLPEPQQQFTLKGLYLPLRLHRQAGKGELLIYANYIASLDGRIAVQNAESGEYEVPAAIANPRDWRLYQELAAQSDIMLTSARYFRQLARGCAQDLLPVGSSPDFSDLRDWRATEGLKAQPDVAVLSRSLDIPQAALAKIAERRVLVFTDEQAPDKRVQALEQAGASVIMAGKESVNGMRLKAALAGRGYRSAYMIAGPGVFRTLLMAGVVDRLFLTTRHILLGGKHVQTLLDGDLCRAERLRLLSLYHDVQDAPGQSFAQYGLVQPE